MTTTNSDGCCRMLFDRFDKNVNEEKQEKISDDLTVVYGQKRKNLIWISIRDKVARTVV